MIRLIGASPLALCCRLVRLRLPSSRQRAEDFLVYCPHLTSQAPEGTISFTVPGGRFLGGEPEMKRIRHLFLAVVIPSVIVGTMVGGALSAPGLADSGARPLHLTAVGAPFSSFTCSNDLCSLASATVDGKGTSNLSTGAGSYHTDLNIDFLGQPAPGGKCNIVTEKATFSFDNGTITVQSHHEDCATAGLRIDTTFQVTEGTGSFAGASGGGREFSSVGGSSAVIYQGTITF